MMKHKHRFVVMDSDTYKEKFSFKLSGANLFVTLGVTIIVLIALTTVLIAFTPLREYIPGYTDSKMVEQTYANAKTIDSLERVTADQEWMIATIQAVLRGDDMGPEADSVRADSTASLSHLAAVYRRSHEDSLLREEVEREDSRYELKSNTVQVSGAASDGSGVTSLFYPPVKGAVISPYDAVHRHYGVDIAANANSVVSAAYSGTVVFGGFVGDDGYVVALQHPAGVMTVYRNNSVLLKHQGDVVRVGEPIAFVGNGTSRELGPHLHLEVWVNGSPVNPEDYISF